MTSGRIRALLPFGGADRHPARPAELTREPFCRAPFGSLYFDQRGNVKACCQNNWHVLGRVTEQSLQSIWHGAMADELRAALAADDLSLGCDFCRWHDQADNPEVVYARSFDHLPAPRPDPAWPTQMEFSLTNTCNLQCVMCNGEWSSSIRAHREGLPPMPVVYGDRFFDELAEFLPHLQVAKFLGGEPFLGRETGRVLDLLVDLDTDVVCHVTTNGTQWNDRVRRVLDRLEVHVAVSVDGATAETMQAIRVGARFEDVVANIDRFRDHAAGVTLTYCLMRQNWHELHDYLRFADDRDLDVYVNVVTDPPRFSLMRTGHDDLATVVGAMETQADGGELGRNRPVWDAQLAMLRHHLDRVTSVEVQPVPVDLRRPSEAFAAEPSSLTAGDDARHLMQAWQPDDAIRVLRCDVDDLLTEVLPDGQDLFGMDVTSCLGRPFPELMSRFQARFGDQARSTVLAHTGDLVDRISSFTGETGTTEIRVLLTAVRDTDGRVVGREIYLGRRDGARRQP